MSIASRWIHAPGTCPTELNQYFVALTIDIWLLTEPSRLAPLLVRNYTASTDERKQVAESSGVI